MWLLAAVDPGNLLPARQQMAFSLAWHIPIACLGVGFPLLAVLAEWRGLRTGDPVYVQLARRWAKAMGVLFAVGAVSGTVLSFEMGALWPGLMEQYGAVYGFPFALEGFAFFIEAIFVGIYLYGFDRLSPRAHLLSGIPIVLAGVASVFFVVTANTFMQTPRGFRLENGKLVDARPWDAMFNPSTPPQTTHMILAAFMVSGFVVASVYAVAMLRGRRDRYTRVGLLLPLALGAVVSLPQVVVGDWAAKFVAGNQPTKLAAMEGVYETRDHVPLTLGGIEVDGELRYGLEIPNGLSLLIGYSPSTVVRGLNEVPPQDRPPVTITHLAFDAMVACGFALLGLSGWFALVWWRRRAPPRSRLFLGAVAASGLLAVIALEAGWTTTEVGRQPWIVYHQLRTADAVSAAPHLEYGLYIVLAVYAALTVATVVVLRVLARQGEGEAVERPVQAPQEQPG
ncbi:MAG: cytochrome bd ubiquinol oxidase subunit [Frankiales bacterium]|nr:cytochrome bd ubiquinol oxidase subunit [Frankiales bacterium]